MIRMVKVFDEWDDEIERVSREPGPATRAAFQAWRARMYATGVAATHVDTSALVKSLRAELDMTGDRVELGMQWGNAMDDTPGMVDYAYYEQRRGGEHDFTLPVKQEGDDMADIILRGLAG